MADTTITLYGASGVLTVTPRFDFTSGTVKVYVEEGYVKDLTSGVEGSIALTVGQKLEYVCSNWDAITRIDIASDKVSGDISGWVLPAGLVTFYVYNTGVSGDISGWVLPAGLVTFYVQNTGIDYNSSGGAFTYITNALTKIDFRLCNLTSAQVDNALVDLVTSGAIDNEINIGNNQEPTATGLAAKSVLETNGWTVTVNAQIIRYIDPGATGAANGTSWTDAYTTLAQWEAASQQDLTDGGGDYMTVYCRSSNGAANGGCVINGWTTGENEYVEIIQVDFPANGIYDATKFRITGENVNLIEIYEDYLRFHNLQFVVTASGTGSARGLQCPSMGAENYILVDSCIFKGVCSGTGLGIGFQSGDADVIADVVNCLAYDFYIAGDTHFMGINLAGLSSAGRILNCTVWNCTIGIKGAAAATGPSVYNCAVFNTENDFSGYFNSIDHCASDDGDGTNAQDFTAEATDWNKVFTDYANGDVTLKNYTTSPCCVGVGVDAPGGALYTDDITGTARSTTWDIGAFEYFVAGATLTAETGSYVLTGTAVTLLKSNLLTIGVGNYILTGQAASFLKSSLITVDAGSYTLTGQVVTLLKSSLIEAGVGSYVLTGQAAGLLKSHLIVIGAGSCVITGTAVSLFKGRSLTIESGSYVLTGTAASLLKSSLLSMGIGSYAVTGQAVTLTYTPVGEYVLTAGVGSYVVIGKAAVLRYIAEAAKIPPLMHKDLIDLYSGGAWLWLCEISIPGYVVIRLARNTADVIYGGSLFTKHNFDIAQQSFSGDGSVPQIQFRVAQDADRVLEDKVNATQGACGGSVKLIRASEKFLDTAVEELEHTFDVLTGGSDTEWVTFVLGIPNPLTRRIPLRLYSSKVCPYATPSLFKGPECQLPLEHADETCTGLLEDCFDKGNAHHWGGEPGLDPNTVRV